MLLNSDGSDEAVSGGIGSPGGDVDGIDASGAPNVAACDVAQGGDSPPLYQHRKNPDR